MHRHAHARIHVCVVCMSAVLQNVRVFNAFTAWGKWSPQFKERICDFQFVEIVHWIRIRTLHMNV